MGAPGPPASEALPGPTFQVPHPLPFHLTSLPVASLLWTRQPITCFLTPQNLEPEGLGSNAQPALTSSANLEQVPL